MPSRRTFCLAVIVLGLCVAAPLATQIDQVSLTSAGQSRDTPPPPPQERRIPVGTSSIAGTVVTADAGRPVRGARVVVNGQTSVGSGTSTGGRGAPMVTGGASPAGARGGAPMAGPSSLSRIAVTDESGAFSFARLPAGTFQLSITHSQHLAMNYGQRRYGGQGVSVDLADGEKKTLKVELERPAVITGIVLGPDGEPQRQAQVRSLRYVRNNGVRRLQAQNYVQTDDRGIYRMFGLPPGDYLIAATPNASDQMNLERFNAQTDFIERAIAAAPITAPPGPGLPAFVSVTVPSQPAPNQIPPPSMYLPTFAPGAISASDATVVSVKAGEERTSVDVLVRLVTSTTLQLDLTSPLDPGVNVQFQLRNDDPSADSNDGGQRRDQSGRVYFQGVRPGKYTVLVQTVAAPPQFVQGQPPPPPPVLSDSQKLWASVPVEISGEPLIAVAATLRPARTISGIVTFDTARPMDPARGRATVVLSPAPAGTAMYFDAPPQAQVNADGTFTLKGVIPGRYTLRTSGTPGYLRSSMVSGQDTLDLPFDFNGERDITDAVLIVADTASVLEGTLTDASGKPVRDHTIVIASTDNRFWVPGTRRIATSRPGAEGRYAFGALPAGSYFLAAVQDLEAGAQFDPEFLRELARASIPVTITEGAKAIQDVRVR